MIQDISPKTNSDEVVNVEEGEKARRGEARPHQNRSSAWPHSRLVKGPPHSNTLRWIGE